MSLGPANSKYAALVTALTECGVQDAARGAALVMLSDVQADCAAINVSIGGLQRGTVDHNCLIVTDAPPVVVGMLTATFKYVSVSEGGLRLGAIVPKD
jgi:hypothetical protein